LRSAEGRTGAGGGVVRPDGAVAPELVVELPARHRGVRPVPLGEGRHNLLKGRARITFEQKNGHNFVRCDIVSFSSGSWLRRSWWLQGPR